MHVWARDQQGVTAGAQLVTGPGRLGPSHLTAGAVDAVAKLYDGTSALGRPIGEIKATAASTSPTVSFDSVFGGGLFAVVTGAGATLSYAHDP